MPGIGAAAAEIAAHALADAFRVVAGLALAHQADRAHDLARRAEAALEAVMGDEGGLHRVEPVAVGEALDRQHVGAVQADGQRQAGIDAPPVDQHRAGAALAAVAALLGSGQVKTLAQQVEQRHPRVFERTSLRSPLTVRLIDRVMFAPFGDVCDLYRRGGSAVRRRQTAILRMAGRRVAIKKRSHRVSRMCYTEGASVLQAKM